MCGEGRGKQFTYRGEGGKTTIIMQYHKLQTMRQTDKDGGGGGVPGERKSIIQREGGERQRESERKKTETGDGGGGARSVSNI